MAPRVVIVPALLALACARAAIPQTPAERMVRDQLLARDIRDERVLQAMREVPREEFVPPELRPYAYADQALPIEASQTISQPYIVALMAQLADVGPTDRVLEVGTGSGYGAAVLAKLGREVYTIEIVGQLAQRASERLKRLGATNVEVLHGDGFAGWLERAPFDAIVVTAAPAEVPGPLLEQLAVGGRLVIPVGGSEGQLLLQITRTPQGLERRTVATVAFVPLTRDKR